MTELPKAARAAFWSRPGTFAIVGGFESAQKLSWRILDQCRHEDVSAVPVNPELDEVLGIKAVAEPSQVADLAAIVCVRLDPHATKAVEQAAALGVPVWLSQGTVSEEARAMAERTGAELIAGACPLMYMADLSGGHRLHQVLAKIFRAY